MIDSRSKDSIRNTEKLVIAMSKEIQSLKEANVEIKKIIRSTNAAIVRKYQK